MEKRHKISVKTMVLTWMASGAAATENHSGLQFAVEPETKNFVQFQISHRLHKDWNLCYS